VGTLAVDLPAEDREWLEQAQRILEIAAAMVGYDVRARQVEREDRASFEAENLRLRDALEQRFRPDTIIGNSRAMRAVYLKIQQVAPSETTVLIRGESGTGKELVASAIHYSSRRSKGSFVKVNCAALSESLLESELFGHEKGAFTGALQQRVGRIEDAEGGTLFLDEIGDFSPAVQVKLLRVLQEREYERVGSNHTMRGDVRIIAATNRNLEAAVRDGSFRHDLYYRINVFPVHLPAMRERREDILLLANHFSRTYGKRMGKEIHRISTPAINTMLAYHWPGNVRELENCIEHAVLLSHDGVIHSHHLPPTLGMPGSDDTDTLGTLEARVGALERDMICDALKRTAGNMAAAARELGITPRVIRYKVKNLGIEYHAMFRAED
jgi:Nif-specific regulatory protein